MVRIDNSAGWLWLWLWLAGLAVEAGAEPNLSAVVTDLEGVVTGAPRTASGEIRPLRLLDVLGEGFGVDLPAGGRASLVCSSERVVELRGPRRWTLDDAGCATGRKQDPGTYLSLAPRGGRLRKVGRIFVLQQAVRQPVEGAIVLSPRQTAVLKTRPRVVWRQIPEAIEYEIELTGLLEPLRVDATDVDCRAETAWGDIRVCSVPWPEAHAGLNAEQPSFLNIGYRERITSPLVKEETEGVRIDLLEEELARELKERLAAIEAMPVAGTVHELLRAGAYAEKGLFGAALTAYRLALADGNWPAIQVTLGDLYLEVGLHVFAWKGYQAALEASSEPEIEAAANFGLGRLLAENGRYKEALDHSSKAQQGYRRLGLSEEAEAAAQAVAYARERIPRRR